MLPNPDISEANLGATTLTIGDKPNFSELLCANAIRIPIRDGIARLTVTSPPYHNAINYEKHLEGNSWYRGEPEHDSGRLFGANDLGFCRNLQNNH